MEGVRTRLLVLMGAVAFVLLIVILLFRPTGLLGESLGKARA